MSKLSIENLKTHIHDMMSTKKERKFVETVEMQIMLKDYDPQKDKRFSGTVRLPNQPRINMKICVIGDAAHIDEAKKLGIDTIDQDGLKNFNKVNKDIKKWAKKYHVLLCTDTIVKNLNKLLGNILNRIDKFPIAITHKEPLEKKVTEIKSSIKFQLKKVLTLNMAIGNVKMTEEQLRQNIGMSANFLVSLLKKGWQNIKGIHIKTTMGKAYKAF